MAPSTGDSNPIDVFLPLQAFTFYILLSLTHGDRHGYGIIQDVQERTDGAVRLSAGALYRTIARLLEQGLIVEPPRRTVSSSDPRRRYYRLTTLGRAVTQAETNRLARLVRLARGSGLVPETT